MIFPIYAYAERHKGELVLFIACDYDSRIFYWRNIDTTAIEEFKNKSDRIRTKARYYFSFLPQEKALSTVAPNSIYSR